MDQHELPLIHWEDAYLLIVEKPQGLPTQPLPRPEPVEGLPSSVSLASLLAQKYPELKSVGGSDWGAVHRLDRDTSGLVVFARNEKNYRALRAAFSHGDVEKEYTALVIGDVTQPGRIDWPIGADPQSSRKVKVFRNLKEAKRFKAQEALTTLTPIPSPAEGRGVTTLLTITIKTGVRHQIRAHLAAIGHPIVGDPLYGPKPVAPGGLCLHASRIRFYHPVTGQPVVVVSPYIRGSFP